MTWRLFGTITLIAPLIPHYPLGPKKHSLINCLFSTKPLSKPRLGHCQLDPSEQTTVKFLSNAKLFIHENASENTVCEMAAMLFRFQCITHTEARLDWPLPHVRDEQSGNCHRHWQYYDLSLKCPSLRPKTDSPICQWTTIAQVNTYKGFSEWKCLNLKSFDTEYNPESLTDTPKSSSGWTPSLCKDFHRIFGRSYELQINIILIISTLGSNFKCSIFNQTLMTIILRKLFFFMWMPCELIYGKS